MNTISARKRTVDTDVDNDVTCTRQSVITRVVIRFLLHDVIHPITARSCDKHVFSYILFFFFSVDKGAVISGGPDRPETVVNTWL